ncbi:MULTISPECIES: hypothetical protein [unclassified Coleofasciculus]|uniref:hypothetical protein n=1 Tax=unclassified Coleofasciculus TaxID=2692782 RepID=UPI00187E8637|nr:MULTISPECIES: hypothetical protein [unclassified Coleofasciculus]MBE9128975.1 hypothetical protein [Coleofasciculus sp. LEGE 07081]MBE9148973.1 hypothetical protein [Coleofasciculus sp. LEGE 07092]
MKSEEKSLTIKEILIECPKCGKKSVVQRNPDVYQCLACDFSRDFAKKPKEEPKTDLLLPIIIAFFLGAFLLTLYEQNRSNTNPDTSDQSLSIPATAVFC